MTMKAVEKITRPPGPPRQLRKKGAKRNKPWRLHSRGKRTPAGLFFASALIFSVARRTSPGRAASILNMSFAGEMLWASATTER